MRVLAGEHRGYMYKKKRKMHSEGSERKSERDRKTDRERGRERKGSGFIVTDIIAGVVDSSVIPRKPSKSQIVYRD